MALRGSPRGHWRLRAGYRGHSAVRAAGPARPGGWRSLRDASAEPPRPLAAHTEGREPAECSAARAGLRQVRLENGDICP
ncbi:uncharacterized protein V6R79_025300 [Siganus canaliculatus]